jgi:peptidoglycan/xylan/chitin deacetylase (PgdA/CDA1 family)
MEVEFAFPGLIGDILRSHFRRDCDAAVLSRAFRAYYYLRPWLPTVVRQVLQRQRNVSLAQSPDWYVPVQFWADLQSACRQLKETQAVAGVKDEPLTTIHPWPDGCRYAVCLTHDIESSQGLRRVDKIAAIEEEFGLRSCWFVVPYLYKVDQGLLDELTARGHEVGVHGYNHDGRLFTARSIFDARVKSINSAGQRWGAAGFRAPMVHRNLEWMQALEFDYDASCFDIDPFQAMPGGVGGVWPFMVGNLVELPYTLPQDHTLMLTLGQAAFEVWIRKLEWIKKLAGMALLITHPDYLDSPQRQDDYRRFCAHVAGQGEKWLALPGEIATWWRARHQSAIQADGTLVGPAAGRGRVVRLLSLFES